MVMEKIQLPPYGNCGNWIFSVTIEGFPKQCDMPPFIGDQKNLVTIQHTPTIEW